MFVFIWGHADAWIQCSCQQQARIKASNNVRQIFAKEMHLCLSGWIQKKRPAAKRRASRVRAPGVLKWRLSLHGKQRQVIATSCHEVQDEMLAQYRRREELLPLPCSHCHARRPSFLFDLLTVVFATYSNNIIFSLWFGQFTWGYVYIFACVDIG